MKTPMQEDPRQVRSLFGGISYYRKLLQDMTRWVRPITSLLKQGVEFFFTFDMETIVRELLAELSTPPVLVYPNRDPVARNSRPFLLHCDASVDGFGASNESKTIAPSTALCSSALPSALNVTGPRSIWKRASLSGASSAFTVICGVPISALLRTTRRSESSTRSQSTTPAAVAKISHGVHLHSGIS